MRSASERLQQVPNQSASEAPSPMKAWSWAVVLVDRIVRNPGQHPEVIAEALAVGGHEAVGLGQTVSRRQIDQ